ncbi:hypothetical protein CC78DRAFT_618100 [Lojkania enalia]|uniref:Uncharacterized protein n=1 Tax=Lojkania enalia TaxID=147567 RepID=A0A9P4K4Q3_9PLEO|nr:hypothetical protein CC78DRAFT_618100 [Didymosphaeria enalia]
MQAEGYAARTQRAAGRGGGEALGSERVPRKKANFGPAAALTWGTHAHYLHSIRDASSPPRDLQTSKAGAESLRPGARGLESGACLCELQRASASCSGSADSSVYVADPVTASSVLSRGSNASSRFESASSCFQASRPRLSGARAGAGALSCLNNPSGVSNSSMDVRLANVGSAVDAAQQTSTHQPAPAAAAIARPATGPRCSVSTDAGALFFAARARILPLLLRKGRHASHPSSKALLLLLVLSVPCTCCIGCPHSEG